MAIAGKVAITPKGDWNNIVTYNKLDLVKYNNSLYIAKKSNQNIIPEDGDIWMLAVKSYDEEEFNKLITDVDDINRKLSGIEEGAEATAATISGSNPTVTNSANAPLIYGKIKGYSEQKTLSGKNRLKITNTTETTDGITFTVNEDGNITINGTATADVNFDVTYIANITGNGNIKRKLFQLNGSYTGTVEHSAFTSDWGHSFLVPIGEEGFLNTDITYSIFRIKVSSGTVCNNLKVGFMVAEDVSEYEPFCGGIASPNPDYPQDIKGLGDSGTIEVKTCGKNLVDYTSLDFPTNATGTSAAYSNGEIIITRVADINSGIYSFNEKLKNLGGKKIRTSFDVKTDTEGMQLRLNLGQTGWINKAITSDYTRYSLDFDLTNANMIIGSYPIEIYGNAVAGNMYIKNIMFEDITNTVPEDSTYEPYTETVITIPIDTLYEGDYLEVYADGSGKIVQENDTKVFDGNENWYLNSGIIEGVNLYLLPTGVTGITYTPKSAKSNLYPYGSYYNSSDLTKDRVFYVDLNNVIIRDNVFTSATEFKTFLGSNNLHIVYKREEPTETPLTAEQVQAFKQLYTFDNVTNFFCDGEITARYYVNTDSGYTVGMLQEQAKENLEQIKNDLDKLNSLPKGSIIQIEADKDDTETTTQKYGWQYLGTSNIQYENGSLNILVTNVYRKNN